MTTIQRDPAELKPHPLKKQLPQLPQWQKGGEAFNALCDDVRVSGIRQPLLIDKDSHILDGELRWMAARQLQLAGVPVTVVSEGPATVMLMSLAHRRHLTKSARAYLAFPLLAAALDESKRRRLENLKKNDLPAYGAVENAETLAESVGVSRRLFFYAKEIHEIFRKDTEFKELMEPNILSDDPEECIGLGRVVAGYGGRTATAGKTKETAGQLKLFTEVVEDQFIRIKYWQTMDENGRRQVWKEVDRLAQEVEPEQIEGLIEFHRAMAQRLEKALKEVAK
jgi:hypothetical protein